MTLLSQAATAGHELSGALEKDILVEYLGQRHGPARTPCYRFHPNKLKVRAGGRCPVEVCFRWSLVGSMDVESAGTVQSK